ncbi:MAG: DUF4388 domain-containing protein [Acidobacteriota bacterium]
MSITGNLKTMDLAELLQWLSQSQKTGTLVIHSGEIEKRLFLDKGKIISSSSTDPREYLGHFLVSHDLITEEQLATAMEMQSTQQMLLGKILINEGWVDEKALQRMLRLKAEEGIYDIFSWSEGEFRFLNDELPSRTFVPLKLDLTGILMEGARRVDEWARIREVISSKNAIPVTFGDFEGELSPGALKILNLINDRRTVEEIQLQSHSSEFFVSSVLFEQIKAKRVKVVEPRVVKVEVPAPLPAQPATAESAAVPAGADQSAAQGYPGMQPNPQHPAAAYSGHPNTPAYAPAPGNYTPPHPHPSGGYPMHQPSGGQGQQPYPAPGGAYPHSSPSPPNQGPPAQSPPSSSPPPGQPPSSGAAGSPASPAPPSFGKDTWAGVAAHQPNLPNEPSSADQLDPQSLLQAASEAIVGGDFTRAVRYLRAARSIRPEDRQLETAVKSAEQQIRKTLESSGVSVDKVPKLAVPMETLYSLDVSAQEGFILTRIDGSYDLKSILKISPIPEIEALILFHRLHQAGHITF